MPDSLVRDEAVSLAERAFQSLNEEAMEVPGVRQITSSLLKIGLRPNQVEIGSSKEMDADILKTSKQQVNSVSAKRKLEPRWGSKEDMLHFLSDSREMLMEAVCALYRQERVIDNQISSGLSDSDYKKFFFHSFLSLSFLFFLYFIENATKPLGHRIIFNKKNSEQQKATLVLQ